MLRPCAATLTLWACTRCTTNDRNQSREVANEQADRSGNGPRIRHDRSRGVVAITVAVPADGVFPDAAREGPVAAGADAERHPSARRQQPVSSPSGRAMVDDPGGRDHLYGARAA